MSNIIVNSLWVASSTTVQFEKWSFMVDAPKQEFGDTLLS